MSRQDLADKLTNEVLTEVYGERFTKLDDLQDDAELDNEWEYLNEKFYTILKFYYGDDEVLK